MYIGTQTIKLQYNSCALFLTLAMSTNNLSMALLTSIYGIEHKLLDLVP